MGIGANFKEGLAALQTHTHGPTLLAVQNSPAYLVGNNFLLDSKAVAGLEQFAAHWSGHVIAVFREGDASDIIYGTRVDPALTPFQIVTIPKDGCIPKELIAQASIVLASGDNHRDFAICDQCIAQSVPIVYSIEYTLDTRLKIIALDQNNAFRRIKSYVWALGTEYRRRNVFARANGLQSNGVPAADNFDSCNSNIHTYFDSRMTKELMATKSEMLEKANRLRSGEPLRLAFSGRLEHLKGAHHLLDLAKCLRTAGLRFSLDVFGTGSLEHGMRSEIVKNQLEGYVNIRGPVDFATELVPTFRKSIDLFVCCHLQSDPSCTYLETFGCGVPIIAYRNAAFEGLLKQTNGGETTRRRTPVSMSSSILAFDYNRSRIIDAGNAAHEFAIKHDFISTFRARIDHLVSTISLYSKKV